MHWKQYTDKITCIRTHEEMRRFILVSQEFK